MLTSSGKIVESQIEQECIPVGCVLAAAVAIGGVPQCMLGYTPWVWAWRPHPPGVALETPKVWVWRSPRCEPGEPPRCGPADPPRCGPGDPARPDPSASALGVGLEPPSPARPLNFPPGCGPGNLQGMLGYHPQDLLQGMLGYHPPFLTPVNRIPDMCKNITLPQLRCGR